MCGRARLARRAPARQQQRRLRGLPAEEPLSRHLEPGEAARRIPRHPGVVQPRAASASTACHPGSMRCSTSWSRRRSSSTPGPYSPSSGGCTRPRRSPPCTKRRGSRATGSRRWPPFSGKASAPASSTRRVRRAIRLARRHDPCLRGRRLTDRRRRLDVAPARAPARRRRAHRPPGRRTSQRLGDFLAHLRGRRTLDRATAARRVGRAPVVVPARRFASAKCTTKKRWCTASAVVSSPTTTTSRSRRAWCSRSTAPREAPPPGRVAPLRRGPRDPPPPTT